MREPIFFVPTFHEKIWGGTQLASFGYNIPSNNTGECWGFAAHHHGQSIVKNGPFKGCTLDELWENNRKLFGGIEGDRFPLLVKILDAQDDLSVQIHPNDEFARNYENGEFGKTECWYIIDCVEGAEVILGHHAQSKQEFEQLMQEGKWNDLLRNIPVYPGNFYFIPSGTIHAIGKGILIIETQQNSDITYRLYDYERQDKDGNARELHLEKVINNILIPFNEYPIHPQINVIENLKTITFIEGNYFTVHKWELKGKASIYQSESFMLVSVILGEGILKVNEKQYPFQKGDHFMLPFNFGKFYLNGNADFIVSHV